MELFEARLDLTLRPLAERLRPKSISEVVGQEHVLGPDQPLAKLLNSGKLVNLIITGPPGTGKTSFAKALASLTKAQYLSLNAVDAGVKDLKAAGEKGRSLLLENSERTLLFVDEIHRFNKSQQDVLLPYVEKGELYLIGATTEHPSYELNRALLSRCRVISFRRLETRHFKILLEKAATEFQLSSTQLMSEEAFNAFVGMSDGDGRRFLNHVEAAIDLFKIEPSLFPIDSNSIETIIGHKVLSYDKKSDYHYDTISAFIKSVRGSDPDAALYYMARMIEGGEDPVFIARRLIILASEDIGNAEPRALPLALAGLQAVEAIGLPECAINLAHVATFLACAPKSNRSYQAWNKALSFVQDSGSHEIPQHLKSSEKGNTNYKYPHNYDRAYVEQNYWPNKIEPQKFYEPSLLGQEKLIVEFRKWLSQKKESN